jgi:hypothetical protein
MFPLKNRTISGYTFGKRTWYGSQHLGTDYRATFEPLYAPFDGRIVNQFKGREGGNTIWFEGNGLKIRFMHLNRFTRGIGSVKAGEQIGVTGNTGLFTSGPHLHIDITSTFSGAFYKNFANFRDPEKIDWSSPKPPVVNPTPISGFPKKVTTSANVYVRTAPNTSASLGGDKKLLKGTTITVTGVVTGQNVNGNDKWYVSIKGNFCWTGAFY